MPLDGIEDLDAYSASVNVFEIYLLHTHTHTPVVSLWNQIIARSTTTVRLGWILLLLLVLVCQCLAPLSTLRLTATVLAVSRTVARLS